MIKTERTFTFTNLYENGRDGWKAELIMDYLEKHINYYIKTHKDTFDKLMELTEKELEDVFKIK